MNGGFSIAMFDDWRVSYSMCAYEIPRGPQESLRFLSDRINVASDARRRLMNSVRQHCCDCFVQNMTQGALSMPAHLLGSKMKILE